MAENVWEYPMRGREFPVILYFFPVNQGLSGNYERALAIVEKSLGPEHPHVAASLNNLALLYEAQGKYVEAEPLYKRARVIWEKALGPDHPQVALGLENYAALLRKTGRSTEADRLEARAMAIRTKHARENPAK